jgi:hypothetical protein
MHETLFTFPKILAHYRNAPLLVERERFLQHCAERGYGRVALEKIAWLLRIVAQSQLATQRIVRRADFDQMARPYCASTRQILIHAATQWFAFMGRPHLEGRPEGRFTAQLTAYSTVMHPSGSCTVETHVPAGRVKRASPLRMIWSRSECIQEGHDPISRPESHSVCAKGRQLLQGAFLCGQVCFDIHVGCFNTLMTEPQGNNTDVNTGL